MVISTIFNGVCFDYPPPFHHTCIANLGNLTHCVCSRSMKQRFVMIEFQISFQFVKRKALNYWESEQLKKNLQIANHSRTFFLFIQEKSFLYFNEAREQMESSSSILSPIFLAEHHSLEYLSMSLFRFLNSWKVWKEKKGEEYQFLAAVSPWRVSSRAKWGNNNTSREGKHVISNLSNLLVSITKILQRSRYRWKSLVIKTLITGKENIQT